MDDGLGPQDARPLLRRLSHRKRFRARLAAGFGIRLHEPDEAAAAIAVARRNLRSKLVLWLNCLLLYGIFLSGLSQRVVSTMAVCLHASLELCSSFYTSVFGWSITGICATRSEAEPRDAAQYLRLQGYLTRLLRHAVASR
jgi:hypothetical protein